MRKECLPRSQLCTCPCWKSRWALVRTCTSQHLRRRRWSVPRDGQCPVRWMAGGWPAGGRGSQTLASPPNFSEPQFDHTTGDSWSGYAERRFAMFRKVPPGFNGSDVGMAARSVCFARGSRFRATIRNASLQFPLPGAIRGAWRICACLCLRRAWRMCRWPRDSMPSKG